MIFGLSKHRYKKNQVNDWQDELRKLSKEGIGNYIKFYNKLCQKTIIEHICTTKNKGFDF
ncbi:hypothetical protein B0180_04730 [Moraxella canis]|uniref:Uncharacterized protein n=1 Tax=Moraxella canis TaxID=90239 RepID=A0A1S9ZLC4_9GAMM|nr:hypothetical protein B0180_04730 [Moraxella canis]